MLILFILLIRSMPRKRSEASSSSEKSVVSEKSQSGSDSSDSSDFSSNEKGESFGSSDSSDSSDNTNQSVPNSSTVDLFNDSGKNHSYDKTLPTSSAEFKKKLPNIPKSTEGGRWYYKDNFCIYCDKLYTRLDKHLLRMHKDRETVQKILALQPKNKLRRQIFVLLANIGNERYNKSEELNPDKNWIPKRRKARNKGKKLPYLKNKKQIASLLLASEKEKDESNKSSKSNKKNKSSGSKKSSKKYKKSKKVHAKGKTKKNPVSRVICPVCRGYYSTNTYSRHFSRRHGGLADPSGNTRTLLAIAKREMNEYHPDASDELILYVLPYMKDDVIGLTTKHDSLVIRYGNKYIDEHVGEDQRKLVKGHMRLMSRILIEMKKLDGQITNLESSFNHDLFHVFMDATKIICKVNKKTLGVPYNVHTIHLIWMRLFRILKHKFNDIKRYKKRREANGLLQDYFDSFDNQFSSKICSKAQRSKNIKRRLKACVVEIMEEKDIAIYMEYLKTNRDAILKSLVKDFDKQLYYKLIKYQLVLTMFFNGRRPGEMDRSKVENFENRQKPNESDIYFQQLNSQEKTQALKYSKMICQGKKMNGMDCTTYLTNKDEAAINTIIKYRDDAGIPPNNDYLPFHAP